MMQVIDTKTFNSCGILIEFYHESGAHVVGLLDAVILVRVFAEAEENGVDGHLKFLNLKYIK